MFKLLHSINLAVILLAAWIYLHPFDAARPSMQWIYVAHAIAFISLVLVVVQVFLCPRKRTGYLAFWGIRSQVWSVFVLMAAGFMYWVFDGTASQVLAYSLAVAGMVMFAGGPMLVYGSFPALLPGPASRPCFQRGVAVSPPKMSVMNRVPDDGRNISVMWYLPLGELRSGRRKRSFIFAVIPALAGPHGPG